MVIFHSYVAVYQRVACIHINLWFSKFQGWKSASQTVTWPPSPLQISGSQDVTSASKHQNGQKGPKAMAMAQGNQGSANARIARLNKIQWHIINYIYNYSYYYYYIYNIIKQFFVVFPCVPVAFHAFHLSSWLPFSHIVSSIHKLPIGPAGSASSQDQGQATTSWGKGHGQLW